MKVMKNQFSFFLAMMIGLVVHAQEICDNSIDDDGDGAIDLLDPDCLCLGSVETLLEDFENYLVCPEGNTPCDAQVFEGFNCLDSDWGLSSLNDDSFNCNSPEFFHQCGYFGSFSFSPPTPIPSGEGVIGFKSFNDGWSEGIGQCLDCAFIPGEVYELSFFVGFASTPDTESSSPAEFALYGKEECTLPEETGYCPEFYGWTELGAFEAIGELNEWTLVSGTFTVDKDYRAIVFTKSCDFNSGPNHADGEYHFIDRIELVGKFSGPNCISTQISLEGDCLNGYLLRAFPEDAVQYQWYLNGIAISGANENILPISSIASGEYQVRAIYDDGQCAVSLPANLDDITLDALNVELNGISPTCFGEEDGSIMVSTNSTNFPFQFNWNNGSEESSLIGVGAGSYTVTVADANGCTGNSTITLSEPNEIMIDFLNVPPLCFGENTGYLEAIVADSIGAYEFLWSTGSQDAVLNNVGAGSYAVTIVDSSGCRSIFTSTLNQPDLLSSSVAVTQPILSQGGIIEINADGGTPPYQYNWSNGQSGTLIMGLDAGFYDVTVMDANGCSTYADFNLLDPLMGDNPIDRIYIPNVFSPNEDGFNDEFNFFFYPNDLVRSIPHMQIFDRWGNLVYEARNRVYTNMEWWKGEINGKPSDTGVYVYIIQLELYNGEKLILSGDITLVR